MWRPRYHLSSRLPYALAQLFLLAFWLRLALAQDTAQKLPEQTPEKKTEKTAPPKIAVNPAQIERLETRIRLETNGDSRKEVHARVHINSELGVHQFARLNFDYNRSFESIDIPLVRITHANGGTADILPSAITDNPNPAVVNAPAYQDVRVKTVRILGLVPGDLLEYRVITSVSHHPLAAQFALDHSFDHTGVVSQEVFELDLPASLAPAQAIIIKNGQMRTALQSRLFEVPRVWTSQPPGTVKPIPFSALSPRAQGSPGFHLFIKAPAPAPSIKKSGDGENAHFLYAWQHAAAAKELEPGDDSSGMQGMADVEFGVSPSGWALSHALYAALRLPDALPEEVNALARQLTQGGETPAGKIERIYDFVSQKISTIDLPLGATGFRPRPVEEILSSGYAIPEDKFILFEALAKASNLHASGVLIGPAKSIGALVVGPATFSHLVVWAENDLWLDPSLEVAPFRMLPASYRGSPALYIGPFSEAWDQTSLVWTQIPKNLPFTSSQKVHVDASLDPVGLLQAKVNYTMRGDNELVLRLAFHQTPKEKWKDVAQLLSISDGFRGQVTSVSASDPYATREPFMVEYEISQTKFVDWSKKPIRIPALLPQLGLPDPAAKPAAGAAASPIELGTPLEVETHMTLRLPPGVTTASTPTGTRVQRDYATFASQYSAEGLAITASRHINFLLREIPVTRATDYNAFLRAVQSDEAQDFTLNREDPTSPDTKTVAPKSPAPTTAVQPKP